MSWENEMSSCELGYCGCCVGMIKSLLFTRLIDERLIFWSTMAVILVFRVCTRFVMDVFHPFSWKSFLDLNRHFDRFDFRRFLA